MRNFTAKFHLTITAWRGIIRSRAAMGGFVLCLDYVLLSKENNKLQGHLTMNEMIKSVESPVNPNIPALRSGDMVRVFIRIKEGTHERTQEFKGTLIRIRKSGNDANFTVRRIASNGIGVERTFFLRSPRLEKVIVDRHSRVRRSRLYFLRDRTGKSARLKQKF
jgi:large subunit ribosomal protein L19